MNLIVNHIYRKTIFLRIKLISAKKIEMKRLTLRPFHAPVALQISSPTFLGDKPRGPTLGASDDVAPISPPIARSLTALRKFVCIKYITN